MPYASQADIELAAGGADGLVALADFNNDTVVDAAVIARAQAAADSFIDPYLRGLRPLPLTNPGESLIRLAAEEAVFQIKRWRRMTTPQDDADRKTRERELEDYRKGTRRPDAEPASVAVRSVWVERDDAEDAPDSREGTKGLW